MRSISHLVCALVCGVAALIATATPPRAQSWPQRTVRVVVPNPPGVGMDVIARVFAERLGSRWRQPVIIENLPGADGIIAAREFIQRHDDHTLLYSFPGVININPLRHEKLPYDPRDLVPIAPTSDNALAIAVSTALNVGSLAELAQLAKSRPGRLTWAATPGVPYYGFALFQKETGSEMVQASYRDFNQALIDLREARIDAVAAGVTPLLPHASSGKIKLLAFFNRQRTPVAPDVPTVAEAGYPNLTFDGATGFFGLRDMPAELRERIATDVRAVTADPAVKERLAKIGSVVLTATPSEFAASIEEQRAKFAAIAGSSKPAQ